MYAQNFYKGFEYPAVCTAKITIAAKEILPSVAKMHPIREIPAVKVFRRGKTAHQIPTVIRAQL